MHTLLSRATGPRVAAQQQRSVAGVHAASAPLTSPARRHRRQRRLLAAAPRALLSSDGGASLGSLLMGGAVAFSVGAGLVALYNDSAPLGARRRRLPQPGSKQQQQQQQQLLPASSDDNLRWAVMGVVSCLPLFNWMAWLFGAFDGGPRVYYLYAALYALPLFQHGLGGEALSDPAALSLLVAGALHCQLERVAATEPEERAALARQLSPPALVASVARAAAAALRAADGVDAYEDDGDDGAGKQQQQLPPGRADEERRRGGWLFGGRGGGDGGSNDDDEDHDPLLEADRRAAQRVARLEMEAFDRRLAEKTGASPSGSSGSDEEEDGAGRRQQQQPRYPAPPPPQRQPVAEEDDSGGWGR